MITITKITYAPGLTWAKLIETKWKDLPIVMDPKQHQDVVIEYETDQMIFKNKIACELKCSDLHSSNTGKGSGGKLLEELNSWYLPQRKSNEFDDILLVLAPPIDEPFASYKTEIQTYIANQTKPRARKKHTPEEIMDEIDHFEDRAKDLMKYIHDNALSVRDVESVYSIALDHAIPVIFVESQSKALDKILEYVNNLDHARELHRPQYVNQSNIESQFERMLRQFEGMSDDRIEKLREDVIMANLGETHYPWSFAGITIYFESYGQQYLTKANAFERKFYELFMTGKNPLTNKALKELEKESP